MRPISGGAWRKGRRKAWKGTSRGRRTTHKVETAWGQQHEIAAWNASWAAYRERERQAAQAAEEGAA